MTDARRVDDSVPGQITLRYWAAARAAAGVDEDVLEAVGPMTLLQLKEHARTVHDTRKFQDVLLTCSVLVGDRPVATDDPAQVHVEPGQTVEFLPPFAGG